jgi:hypothetical protein
VAHLECGLATTRDQPQSGIMGRRALRNLPRCGRSVEFGLAQVDHHRTDAWPRCAGGFALDDCTSIVGAVRVRAIVRRFTETPSPERSATNPTLRTSQLRPPLPAGKIGRLGQTPFPKYETPLLGGLRKIAGAQCQALHPDGDVRPTGLAGLCRARFHAIWTRSSLAEIGWATWSFVPHFVPHQNEGPSREGRPRLSG